MQMYLSQELLHGCKELGMRLLYQFNNLGDNGGSKDSIKMKTKSVAWRGDWEV